MLSFRARFNWLGPALYLVLLGFACIAAWLLFFAWWVLSHLAWVS